MSSSSASDSRSHSNATARTETPRRAMPPEVEASKDLPRRECGTRDLDSHLNCSRGDADAAAHRHAIAFAIDVGLEGTEAEWEATQRR
mmetsp:Transcript_11359/g.28791  ORF Transcript_11359/g.28791 Transcript_11359/m.28791 type:complete len:88 (+) Transcript_11359:790-1053(+)